ncbi:hypothetical protein RHA1_ro06933 [Rhodococcus jostii RHA1]|uniref:Uncharacterized protein n=1 Tax=Rhodococcus jostii (strain RHA1) TaxID=101510 RepID=Q0S187_RHOJR|nr:hypothetical protein RHA1_ro06933 [Rhodococcus jostii RHA1]
MRTTSQPGSAHQRPEFVEVQQLLHILPFGQRGHGVELGQLSGAGRRNVELHQLGDPLPDLLMDHARSPPLHCAFDSGRR